MGIKQRQLLVAVVVFLLVAFVSYSYVQGIREEGMTRSYRWVAVAKQGIKSGDKLTRPFVGIEKVPEKYVPKAAVADVSKANVENELGDLVGQELNVNVINGDYLMRSYFGERQAVAGKLSGLIPDANLRAINLPVDETNSLARSITPGDKIDILFTFQIAGLSSKISTVLLQNVQVISTGSYSVAERELGAEGNERSRRYSSLTLLLPNQDAVRLSYARQMGSVSIMLRRPSDAEVPMYQPILGIEDILPAAERDRVQAVLAKKEAAAQSLMADDKYKEQIRQMMDQKKQSMR